MNDLTKADWAKHVGASERTVTRWLALGVLEHAVEVPGAGGYEWRIPRDQRRPTPAELAEASKQKKASADVAVRPPAGDIAAAPTPATSFGAGRFFWTVDELEELFTPHLTRAAILKMLREGELLGYKRGQPNGTWLVPTGELRRLMGA